MEITLEKIELVKDRTGVGYKEAKEALEKCDGSVVDAIIAIEENVDKKTGCKANEYAKETVEKIREFVNKGNISKISVKHNDEVLMNIPVSVGLIGAVIAPWGAIAAAIAALGFKCKIELTTDDGKIIDVSEKVDGAAMAVKEKGGVIVDEVMEKAPDLWENIKAKGEGVVEEVKEKAPTSWDELKAKGESVVEEVKEKAPEFWQSVKEKTPDTWEDVKGLAQEKFNDFKNRSKDNDILDDIEFDFAEEDSDKDEEN